MPNRVIARYRDGRLLKGTTINFRPDAPYCHVVPIDHPYDEGTRVDLRELKALFFVRDLRGDPTYQERKEFVHRPGYGRRARVVFHDGEEMLGIVHTIDRRHLGFFLFPADPASNNERVYAIFDWVKSVELLDEPAADAGATSPEQETPSTPAAPA